MASQVICDRCGDVIPQGTGWRQATRRRDGIGGVEPTPRDLCRSCRDLYEAWWRQPRNVEKLYEAPVQEWSGGTDEPC